MRDVERRRGGGNPGRRGARAIRPRPESRGNVLQAGGGAGAGGLGAPWCCRGGWPRGTSWSFPVHVALRFDRAAFSRWWGRGDSTSTSENPRPFTWFSTALRITRAACHDLLVVAQRHALHVDRGLPWTRSISQACKGKPSFHWLRPKGEWWLCRRAAVWRAILAARHAVDAVVGRRPPLMGSPRWRRGRFGGADGRQRSAISLVGDYDAIGPASFDPVATAGARRAPPDVAAHRNSSRRIRSSPPG